MDVKYEKLVPDKEFLDKTNKQYDECTTDIEMLFQEGKLTEEQKIDLLQQLDKVRTATKEDMRKGILFFSMWINSLKCQVILTQMKKEHKT